MMMEEEEEKEKSVLDDDSVSIVSKCSIASEAQKQTTSGRGGHM